MATWLDLGIELPHGATGNVKTTCPECSHTRRHSRDKCLSVDVEQGLFRCHNCGWRGSLRSGEATDAYGSRPPRKVYVKPEPDAAGHGISTATAGFFAERKIPISLVVKHAITGDDGAIRFPYFRDRQLVNVKTRRRGKRFSMEAGCELIFWGLDDCATAEQVVIVEGELDKLACEAAGLPYVLSVPNGAQTGAMDFLASGEAIFDRCHTIILAVDMDEPGLALEAELARRIGKEKCYRVRWPNGHKDANDVLIHEGAGALLGAVADAEPFPLPGIQTTRDIRADALDLYRQGRQPGVETGWLGLRGFYTVKPGQMSIVTGTPGSGKSEWLDALMMNLVCHHRWPFAVFSPENSPAPHHYSKLAEKYYQKPFADGPTPRMTEAEFDDFLGWAYERVQLINVEEPDIETILDLARQLVFRLGIKGLIIDPWNEVEHNRPANLTETEYISECLGKIRRFARHHDLHAWVVAHPKKLYRDKDGALPVPTPYDISGSANWYNKADNCITISRDKEDDASPVQVIVQKIRFKEIGHVGTAQLRYDRVTGCFRDLGYAEQGAH